MKSLDEYLREADTRTGTSARARFWVCGWREMPNDDLFTTQWVKVELPPEESPGYKGEQVVSEQCGEGINFRREVMRDGKILCRACAGELLRAVVKCPAFLAATPEDHVKLHVSLRGARTDHTATHGSRRGLHSCAAARLPTRGPLHSRRKVPRLATKQNRHQLGRWRFLSLQLEKLSVPSRLLPHVHALPRVGAALSPDAMSSYGPCGESRDETNGILASLPAPEAHHSRPSPSSCRDPIRADGRVRLSRRYRAGARRPGRDRRHDHGAARDRDHAARSGL
jgi:hypothetical protein